MITKKRLDDKLSIYFETDGNKKSPTKVGRLAFLHEKKKNYAFFWYLFLNFSTRPAVSTNIFLPVKNG